MESDRSAGVNILLHELHSDLVLLTRLNLVSVGVSESCILSVYKDYQLQTGGDFIVYLWEGDFLITGDFGGYSSALRYKVYLVN